jgi:uncharacterized alpha-E superfamily protein
VLGLVGTATKYSQKDDFLLTPLLEICDSSMTYRRLHFARPSLVPVLDLLLLNDSNPRSAAHQFQILGRLTAQLPQAPGIDLEITPRHLTDGLQSDLLGINLAAIAKTEAGVTDAIPSISEKIAVNLEKLSDLITEHFFSHASRKVEET